MDSGPQSVVRRAVAGVATLAASLLLVGATSPPAGAATSTQIRLSHGAAVYAYGSSVSPDGCRETFWLVNASDSSDGGDAVHYNRTTWDSCSGTPIESITGTAYTDVTVRVTALRSARVVATIQLTNWLTGESAGLLRLDDTFTAYGRAQQSLYREVVHHGDSILRIAITGAWRAAATAGTVPMDSATITAYNSHALVRFLG